MFTITFRATVFTLTARSVGTSRFTTFAFGAASIRTAITLGSAITFRTTALRSTITIRATVSIDTAILRAISVWSAITGTRAFAIARRTHRATDQFGGIELSVMIGVEFIEEVRQLGQLVLRDATVVVLVEFANEYWSARSLRTTVSLGTAPFRTSCLGTTITFRPAVPFGGTISFRTTGLWTTVSLTAFAVRTAAFGATITIRAAFAFGTTRFRTTITFRTATFGSTIALAATCFRSSITFGSSVALWPAATFRPTTAFRTAWWSRQVLDELFLCQRSVRLFASTEEGLCHDLLGSFGSLFHRDLAIAVRIEATEHLFGVAERRTATFGASLIRTTSTFGSSCTLGPRSFRTSTFRAAGFGILTGPIRLASLQALSHLSKVFLSQLALPESLEERRESFSRFGGQFVLGQLAIAVGIESLEHLALSGTLTTGASLLSLHPRGGLDPFFLRQFRLAESLEDLPEAIAQRFGKLVLRELAIIVLVELLEGLFRIGPLSAETALATRCGELCKVVGRQFGLTQSIERRLESLANLLG